MPGSRTYVLFNVRRGTWLREDARETTMLPSEAGRFGEGVALDIIVERANITDPEDGLVLMLSPEWVSR